jgi:predicted nucleotidyltransferase component of viral defense system
MIDKREILDAATALGLNPHVVEKDYVLGWLLWGIYGHNALAKSWVFKGGTCLKKCFFETYRFSEDLDFTLTDESHLDAGFLKTVFAEIGERIYEATGIQLPSNYQEFEIYTNPRGTKSCQGKIGYQGPVSPRGRSTPRIKLDLTADECVVLAPVQSSIFHPYTDMPDGGITAQSYAYEEAFGEKIRALAERARPRDLYDVIHLYRNDDARPAPAVLLDVLRQKCAFKGIEPPILASLHPHKTNLEGGWNTMLTHQLPALPPVETFWDELPAFFDWLEGGAAPAIPAAYMRAPGEEVIRERTLRLPVSGAVQSYLEIIRFAASNRLCVDLVYQGSTRRIEPYSLRRTKDGNIILHAHNLDKGEHRSYRVDRIQGAQVTNQIFVPRFEIELTPAGPVAIAPTTTGVLSPSSGGFGTSTHSQPYRARTSRRSTGFGGPTYIYECAYCGKRFRRKKQITSLNPHKDKSGYPCSGRYAHWVDTQY